MLVREPTHIQIEQELLALSALECEKRVLIRNYFDSNYIPSEVLVTIIRARFGADSGHLRHVTQEFMRRLAFAIARYLRKKPEWQSMDEADNQLRRDCASEITTKILDDEKSVSFAECRFTEYFEDAMLDCLRARATMKSSMVSVDSMVVDDEEVDSYIELVADEDSEGPEAAAIRLSDHEALEREITMLPDENMRKAIYYRDLMEYPWEKVTELMSCTKPTAMKYRTQGIEQLSKVLK